MYITFLGTSSGSPSRQRNVSATALQQAGSKHWILVDCGEATQHQLLRTALSPLKLKAVLITHIHGDHCYGLPGLLASAQLSGRTEPLLIIAPAAIEQYLNAVISITQMQLNYEIRFIAVESYCNDQSIAGFDIRVVALNHRVASYAYRFTENNVPRRLRKELLQQQGVPSGPEWGLLQKGRDVYLADGRLLRGNDYSEAARSARSLIIAGDNDDPSLLKNAITECELLVHEATYTEAVLQQVGEAPQHSSAARVAAFAQSVGLPHLILTHFSPRYQAGEPKRGNSIDEIRAEAAAIYTADLQLANDFDCFWLKTDGELLCLDARAIKRNGGRADKEKATAK
ncbi:MBL fold metallo-hydrolase [Marinobacterium jannaschii]|uniref:MBL fold metallo-hydrolase n=1 Tax=Marinobacterium jannaschii TaxID=64970 RepID=UPI000686412F|nr:MBL fold metallo-hydrolase [Marinobacterium jannaschii]